MSCAYRHHPHSVESRSTGAPNPYSSVLAICGFQCDHRITDCSSSGGMSPPQQRARISCVLCISWFQKTSVLIGVHPWFPNESRITSARSGSGGTSPARSAPSVSFRVLPWFPNSSAPTQSSNRNRPLTRRRSQRHLPEHHSPKSIRGSKTQSPSVTPRFAARVEPRPPSPRPPQNTNAKRSGSGGTSPSQSAPA